MEKYIFDIVLGVVAVVIVVYTAKRGFVLSLLNTIAVALSGFLSYKFSKPVSEFIYSSFLYDKIETKLTEVLSGLSKDVSFDSKIQAMTDSLPESMVNASQGLGVNLESAIKAIDLEVFSNEKIVNAFIDNVASDIIISVLEVVSFVVLFVLLSFILKNVAIIFSKLVRKIPIVGKANTILGGVLGVVKAFVLVVMICFVICPLVFVIDIPWLENVISQSIVYQFLIENNSFNNFM